MANRHFYFLIISHLGPIGTNELLAKYETITVAPDPTDSPANKFHWKIRLDGLARIYEAFFNEAAVSVPGNKGRLVGPSGVPANKIDASESVGIYGPEQNFTHADTLAALMDCIILGGGSADWETSRLAALAYIFANLAEWENGP